MYFYFFYATGCTLPLLFSANGSSLAHKSFYSRALLYIENIFVDCDQYVPSRELIN